MTYKTEWKRTAIINYIELIGGGTPKTSVPEYWDGKIPWLSVKDFNNDCRYVYQTEKHISEMGLLNSSTNLLSRDDIIISARGTVGELAMIPFPMAFNQSCYGIRSKTGIDSTFLYYLIKNSLNQLRGMTHGSVFDTITRETFSNLVVNIPDENTQLVIADILSKLDDKIELNNKINNNLQQQVQLIYENFITTIDKTPMTMSDVIDVRDGTHDSPKPVEFGYPLVTSKHLLPFGVDVSSPNKISTSDYNKVNERSKVDTNDILLSMIGTVGLVSLIIEEKINFAIKNVGLFKTSKCPQYIYYLLCYLKSKETAQHIERCLAGSTQKYISLTELRKMQIIIPNAVDINKFNDLVTPLFSLIIDNVKANKVLTAIRDNLLPKLISGALDVTNIYF